MNRIAMGLCLWGLWSGASASAGEEQLAVESPESVSAEAPGEERVDVPRGAVRGLGREERDAVKSAGRTWFSDPNRSHYFLSSSAMTLRAGEGYVAQDELIVTILGYGITDQLSVRVGTSLPLYLFPNPANFLVSISLGYQAAENVHLSLEGGGFLFPVTSYFGGGGGLATITLGSRDVHLSLSGGGAFVSGANVGGFVAVLAGNARIAQNFALVTENWLFVGSRGLLLVSGGLRIMGDRFATDLGCAFAPGGLGIPIPWLGFAYNFGP